jgi:hypothetical protein
VKSWSTGFGPKSRGGNYDHFPTLGLGLTLWEGSCEGKRNRWPRSVDAEGKPIPRGKEQAEQERWRVEQSEQLPQQERERTERIAEMLRRLGKVPNKL